MIEIIPGVYRVEGLRVANVYLLIAEEMGLIGLTSFLIVMGILFARFWRVRSA